MVAAVMKSLSELGLDPSAVLDQTPAVTYVAAADDPPTILYASESANRLLGFPAQMFVDQPGFFRSRVHPDDVDSLVEARDTALAYGLSTRDRRIRVASGEWRWFRDQFSIVRDAEGKAVYGVGTIIDVTEEKLAQLTLDTRTSE